MSALGTHLLLELRDCDDVLLNDVGHIKRAMISAAAEAGATIVGHTFHKFNPRGVTGIVAIAESHLCVHTWPEHSYAAADIFTCGTRFLPHKAAQLLIERLRCKDPSVTEIKRGLIRDIAPTAV